MNFHRLARHISEAEFDEFYEGFREDLRDTHEPIRHALERAFRRAGVVIDRPIAQPGTVPLARVPAPPNAGDSSLTLPAPAAPIPAAGPVFFTPWPEASDA